MSDNWERYSEHTVFLSSSKVFKCIPPFQSCLTVLSFTSRQTALESSVSISTIPIPVGRTAPCGRIIIL